VPAIIKKYLPLDLYEVISANMFEMVLSIIKSNRFAESESTSQMLVRNLIKFAEKEDDLKLVHEFSLSEAILGIKITTDIRHEMV
jgi:hypothetical protein